MGNHYDVVIVGAGFAGLIAARELSRSGRRVAVLEARDRIGGRTWLADRMGLDLELGGTWVHWTQPHVWSELRRYGLGLAPSPTPVRAFWWDGESRCEGDPDELMERLDEPNRILTSRSREVFPEPFSPRDSVLAADVDGTTMLDHINDLPIGADQRAILRSFWTLNFNGRLEDAAYTQALRWVALTNGDWKVNFEACASYKIAGGTRALLNAIRSDIQADIRFEADVQHIAEESGHITVRTADGIEITAVDVILTAPLQTLDRITFAPPPPAAVTEAVARGQVGLGTKIWFAMQGELPHFVALGDADWPLNFFQSEYTANGLTYVIGFGPDAAAIDPSDADAVQEVLRRLVPDAEVTQSVGHNWVADEFSQETWPMHRPGYLTRSLPALQRPWGRVHLAGADIADGWGGFIDGAIESGLTAARRLLDNPVATAQAA
jgi:monoamine oxidase